MVKIILAISLSLPLVVQPVSQAAYAQASKSFEEYQADIVICSLRAFRMRATIEADKQWARNVGTYLPISSLLWVCMAAEGWNGTKIEKMTQNKP